MKPKYLVIVRYGDGLFTRGELTTDKDEAFRLYQNTREVGKKGATYLCEVIAERERPLSVKKGKR